MTRLLIDADTGVDDSIALLYALNHPDVEIVGITTVTGNTDSLQAGINTLKILDLADAPDIPVVVGADRPLEEKWHGPVTFIHGENGIGNVELPDSERTFCRQDVSDFMMETAERYAGELVLVTLGPLTNVARTLERYPDFAKKIRRVVSMGGTLNMRGNVSPVAEANFAGDPRACDMVFQSGMDILAVGLDVTIPTRLTKGHLELLKRVRRDSCKKTVDYMDAALTYYRKGSREQNYSLDDCPLHDPLAMVAALHPELFRVQKRRARIECGGTYCKGMVVTDTREKPFQAEYVSFAVDVERERAVACLLAAFWE